MIRKPNPQAQAKVLVDAMRTAGVDLRLSTALDIVARQNGHKSWNVMAAAEKKRASSSKNDNSGAALVLTAKAASAKSAYDTELNGWCVGDVTSVRPDLYPTEALGVLQEVVRQMDATIGINWDVLSSQADWLFPEHRVATVRAVGPGVNRMVELDLANGDLYHAPETQDGACGLALRAREYFASQQKLELPEEVELIYGNQSVSVGALLEDSSAREDILCALGDPRLLGSPSSQHALPFSMTLTLTSEGASLDAAGLFKQLETTQASRLEPDVDTETAVASGAAEALSSLVLALATRGVDVWSREFCLALQETTESLANELS